MKNVLFAIYAIINYLGFLAMFSLFVAFTYESATDWHLNAGENVAGWQAGLINILLVAVFGLQHSIMARAGFKQRIRRYMPPALERSTFVLAANLCLLLLVVFWQPMPDMIWKIENPVLRVILNAVGIAGWLLVPFSTYLLNHFELFGLQQAFSNFRSTPMAKPTLKTPSLYRWVRHPLQTGILFGLWFRPDLTAAHLLLNIAMTLYIFIGLYYEERDLIRQFGERYLAYRRAVPQVLPTFRLWKKSKSIQ